MRTDREFGVNWRTGISLSFLSMSIVSYEIYLMHFFSIVQWQHFASMVISIALLGFGASGTLLSLFREKFLQNSSVLIPFFMLTTGLFMSISIPLSRTELLLFDSYTLFVDGSQILKLTANYLLFFLPFFSGALAIGLIFIKEVSRIGDYYFADLLGAGLGGLLALSLMWVTELDSMSLTICALPFLSGLLTISNIKKRERKLLVIYALGGIFILIFMWNRPLQLKPSSYKSISYALNLPKARIDLEHHSPYGLLQVVNSPAQRYAPGLSLRFQGEVRSAPAIFNNGNWYAVIPATTRSDESKPGHKASDVLDFTTMALPYEIRPVHRLLQLNAGAGFEVSQALGHRVSQIDAVEPNAAVLDLISGTYASGTDSLYFDPRVQWHLKTPRSFIQESDQKYDLIQLPLLGTFGGSVGLDALDEDWTLTREGLGDLWSKMDQEGMLTVSCWIDVPQKMSMRLSGLIADLLEQEDITDPLAHTASIRSWGTLTYVISKAPFSSEERKKVSNFCENLQFDILQLDDPVSISSDLDQTSPYNLIQDQGYENNLRIMFTSNRDSLVQAFPFNIKVPTDNRPYFFQFLRLRKWSEQKALWGESTAVFLELGYFLVLITFGQLVFFALVFILLPLLKLRWKGQGKARVIIYFASLGLGYMFVEIVLIKFFQIYLGHPIYSIAAVISIMLISSGLGSRFSERFGLNPTKLRQSLIFIGLIVLIYALLLGFFLRMTVGTSLVVRVILTSAIVALPGFLMGMPFPLGIKLLNERNESQVPWAWGINGCVSVISTSLAAIIAVEIGFMSVLVMAAIAYSMAYASVSKAT